MAATKIGTAATYQAQPTAKRSDADGQRNTYTWHGDYAALNTLAGSYTVDSTTIDGLTVRSKELSPEAGGLAKLTIVADNIVATGGGGNGGGGTDPVYELEWVREDKDIKNHPKFQAGGTYELTVAGRQAVDNALNNDGVAPASNSNAYQLYSRLQKGVTSYPVGIPVARSTTYTITRPTSSGAWVRGTPPALCGAPANSPQTGAAYVYVKTADRVVRRSGGFERVQEWSGFEDVDALLYPA
jgi:hypothetical protein